MFEGVADGGVVAAVEEATRQAAAAEARRLAAVAELVWRRVGDDDPDDPRQLWACDPWDSAAAEVAAAMNISARRAAGQMRIAATLREHLPLLAGLFAAGCLSVRVVSAITWRTRLITDDQVWAALDRALSRRAQQWGPLAEEKLIAAVDALVFGFDPDAVIASTQEAKTRDFTIGYVDDEAGLASVWGTLLSTDAAVLTKRVDAIAATVCPDDPRSAGERRADALGALANDNHHLACLCTSPRCPARAAQPAPKSSVVVDVYTDQSAVDAAQATPPGGAPPPAPAPPLPASVPAASAPAAPAAPAASAASAPAPAASAAPAASYVGTALLSGTEVMPTSLLAHLLANGATLRPLKRPEAEPESRYRPSAKLARFVRGRDLTCRFPGCTAPAQICDIDHVIPYPAGVTHPSNLVCLCRKHHHLKTFWAGDWNLNLSPDGAAVWTAPTGRTYTTYPGCRSFFPDWDTHTGELPPPPPSPQTSSIKRGLMMPQRQRSRAADRDARIKAERQHNNRIRTSTTNPPETPPSTPHPPSDPDPPTDPDEPPF
jgi:hypothetical protein